VFEHSPPTVPPIVELCGCVCVGGWLRPFKDTAWHRSRMASGCSRACAWCSLQLLDAALHSRGNGRVLHFVTSTPTHSQHFPAFPSSALGTHLCGIWFSHSTAHYADYTGKFSNKNKQFQKFFNIQSHCWI